ncbi:jg3156 [Pararge aegeria aegeria]|uniref:Jg3156 protein n=1 Tax=Pararge aegeria aegeria TaxID=348720 RepID=A0A8S4QEP9_9NEOP|nr:jg3156 [Pararge aegeria aegeria]
MDLRVQGELIAGCLACRVRKPTHERTGAYSNCAARTSCRRLGLDIGSSRRRQPCSVVLTARREDAVSMRLHHGLVPLHRILAHQELQEAVIEEPREELQGATTSEAWGERRPEGAFCEESNLG